MLVFLLQLPNLLKHLFWTFALRRGAPASNNAQIGSLPQRQTVFTDSQFPGDLRLGSAAVNYQLHRLALKVSVVSFLNLLFFHRLSHSTLSVRVHQIEGGSRTSNQLALVEQGP